MASLAGELHLGGDDNGGYGCWERPRRGEIKAAAHCGCREAEEGAGGSSAATYDDGDPGRTEVEYDGVAML